MQIQRSDIPDSEALSATVRLNTSGAGGPKLQVAPANLDIYACRGPTPDAGRRASPSPRGERPHQAGNTANPRSRARTCWP